MKLFREQSVDYHGMSSHLSLTVNDNHKGAAALVARVLYIGTFLVTSIRNENCSFQRDISNQCYILR